MENITTNYLATNVNPMFASMHFMLAADLKKTMIGKTYYEGFEDIVKYNLKNDKTYESIPDEYKPYYIESKCYQYIRDKKIGMDIIAETVVGNEMNIIMKEYPYIFGNSEVIQTPKLERYDYDMAFFVNGTQIQMEGEHKSSQENGAIHLGSTVKNYIENIIKNPTIINRLLLRSMYKNTDTKNDVITSMDFELLINSLRINQPYDKKFYVFNIYDLKSGWNKSKHIITSHEKFDDSLKILIAQYCNGVYTIENVKKVYLMTMINTILYNNNMNLNTNDECLKMIIDNEPEIYKEAIDTLRENGAFSNDGNETKYRQITLDNGKYDKYYYDESDNNRLYYRSTQGDFQAISYSKHYATKHSFRIKYNKQKHDKNGYKITHYTASTSQTSLIDQLLRNTEYNFTVGTEYYKPVNKTDNKSASTKYRDNKKNIYAQKMESFPVNTFIKVLKSGVNRDIYNPADYNIYKKVDTNRIVLLNTAKLVIGFITQNAKTNIFRDVTSEYNNLQKTA